MANDVKIRLAMEGASVVASEFDRVNGSMGKFVTGGEKLNSVLGVLGVTLSVGYFVGMIRGSIDAADHLKDLSKSTNIAVTDLAGLKLLAAQTGTDLGGLAKGINKMSTEMGKDPEKFRALGITAKDNVKALQQFADLFNKLPDINQRNALAQAVFSKSWAEMAPALSEGGKRIGEIMEKGTALSGVTTQMADDADDFNDKWAELTTTGGLLTRQIAPMLPLMIALADDMLKVQEKTIGASDSFSPLAEAFRTIIIFGGNVMFVLKGIGTEIGGMAAQLAALASGDFKGALAIGDMMKKDAVEARAAFDLWEKNMLSAGKTARETAAVVVTASEEEKKAAAKRAADFLRGKTLAEAAAKERTRMLEQDRKGWVDLAEFKIKEYEEELAAQNKLDEERNAYADKMRAEDLKGWVAYAEARVDEDFDMAKQIADQQIEENKRIDDARKKQQDEWQKSVDQYDDIFRTGFADMLNGGKGAWKSFTTSLVTTFKTSVADQIYKMFMQPFVVKMVGSLLGMVGGTMGGVANAATGAAGGGAGSGIMSGLGMATSALGTGFAGGLAAWGAGGSIMGSLSAGASLLGTGTMAGGMAGAGMIVGALAPIALGIGALVAISKATQGETRSGADYTINPVTGQITQGYTVSGGELAGKDVRGGISATASNINTRFAAIGSDSRLTGFQAGLNASDRGRGGVFSGGTLSTGATFGETGIGDAYKGTKFEKTSTMSPDAKTAAENFFTDLNQVAIQALQVASGVPKSIRALIDGVDTESLSAEASAALVASVDTVIGSVTNLNAAVKLLPFKDLKTLSFDAAAGLIAAAGGLEALGSTLGSYYTNFYSAAEQTAQLADNTAMGFASLGFAMPAVNEGLADWYRTQVDAAMALDQSIPANAQATAGLLSLNSSVKTLADGAKSAADSIRDAMAGISATVDASLFGMQYGMADDPGKYNMLDVQAATYNDKMLAATDPLKIADYGQKTMESMAKAWGLLTHDQQVQSYAAFEARYEAIDTFVQDKGADALSLQGARDDRMATKFADAVEVAVARAMEKSEKASKDMADAAILLAAAADKPATANVSLTVTAPEGSEVSISEGNFA